MEVLLVVAGTLYATGYLAVKFVALPDYNLVPCLAVGMSTLMHATVFALRYLRPRHDTCRSVAIAIALAADGFLFSLIHPAVQSVWAIDWAGSVPCKGLAIERCMAEEYDYRTDGPLVLQWMLCYQVLFLAPALYGVFATSAGIAMYHGVVWYAGTPLGLVDIICLAIPAALFLTAKFLLEQAQSKVNSLIEQLAQAAYNEKTMRIEAELAVRAQVSCTRAGIDEEGDSSVSWDLSSSSQDTPLQSNTALQQQQEPQLTDGAPIRKNILRQKQGQGEQTGCVAHSMPESLWQPFRLQEECVRPQVESAEGILPRQTHDVRDASSRTEAGSRHPSNSILATNFSDGTSQTFISWTHESLKCSCCAKPPLPPQRPSSTVEQHRSLHTRGRGVRGRRSQSPSSSSSDSGSEHSAWQLRAPNSQKTPHRTKVVMLLSDVMAWNFKVNDHACCDFHSGMQEVEYVAKSLRRQPCVTNLFQHHNIIQCTSCGVCIRPEDSAATCFQCGDPIYQSQLPIAGVERMSL